MKNAATLFLVLSLSVVLPAALPSELGTTATAAAQEGGSATRFFRQRHEDVLRIIRREATTDEARAARSAEITRILSDLLDYQELARRALGSNWESKTPAQRTQFVELLKRLVERNYEQNLERIQDFELRYTAEETVGDGIVVRTEARSRADRRSPAVEIAYTMRRDGSVYRVFDVTTDGVSMVRNYQNQFNRIISQNGWDELIRRMEQRLAAGAPG